MSKARQNWMKKSDVLFSKLVRDRDGRCLAVGAQDISCSGNLQCCHILGRGELVLRTNFDNAITMCQAHHVYFTHRPAAWHDFIDALLPGRWDDLRLVARDHRLSSVKVDWKLRHETLKRLADSLGVA